MEQFKNGQEVRIKQTHIFGTIIKPRANMANEAPEDQFYHLHIPEQDVYVRPTNFEVVPEPDPNQKPERFSSEWRIEFSRFLDLGKRCLANPTDEKLTKQFFVSGERLGFIVPK